MSVALYVHQYVALCLPLWRNVKLSMFFRLIARLLVFPFFTMLLLS